ncbi:GAF domain-containing protein [Candidatus Fermentibacteria bacterium]|nr:GAF domain-containing protein [Candidatus Fermentibacteria bacterium]
MNGESLEGGELLVSVSDDRLAAVLQSDGEHRLSKSLTDLLGSTTESMAEDFLSFALDRTGEYPARLGESYLLCTVTLPRRDARLLVAELANPKSLQEYLDRVYGSENVLLVRPEGSVCAASSHCQSEMTKDLAGSKMAEILDSSSSMAFQDALEDCLAGRETYEFTVRTRMDSGHGGVQVVRIWRLGVPGNLVAVALSSPTLNLADFSPEEINFLDTVMSNVPVPAIRLGKDGTVVRANEELVRITLQASGKHPKSTNYLEWIHPEDRQKMNALQERRNSGHYAPIKYQVRLSLGEGMDIPCEVTALRTPSGDETLAFIEPLRDLPGYSTHIPQAPTSRLAELLDQASREDMTSNLLELIRSGVHAYGVLLVSREKTVSAGEVPIAQQETQRKLERTRSWEETEEGTFNLTLPIRHERGLQNLRLYGLPSDNLPPMGRFFLSLAPHLISYIASREYQVSLARILDQISNFVSSLSSSEQTLQNIAQGVAATAKADMVLLSIVRGTESVLQPLAGYGLESRLPSLPVQKEYVSCWSYTHGEIAYVADMPRDARFVPLTPDSKSELGVPLVHQGRIHGSLLVCSRNRGSFGAPIPAVLQAVASSISLLLFGAGGFKAGSTQVRATRSTSDRLELEALFTNLADRIRTPITSARTNLDMALGGKLGELSDDQREALMSMDRALLDIAEQSEKLLTFMKLDLAEGEMDSRWAHPSGVIEDLMTIFVEKGERKDVEIIADLPDEPFTACFDRNRLEAILISLVDNGIHFNKPGGSVTVSLRRNGKSWVLEVSDTGRGIPSSALPHIYDRFYTGGSSADTVEGMGLGLAIVKKFTESLDGTITVWSQEGQGTRFILRFPISG